MTRGRKKGRGGKAGHEPRVRVRLREIQVMEEILEGRTQQQIAISLGISQPAVSKIARRVEERLLADVAFKADRQRARQTLRLEHIYGEAMRAWQDSRKDSVVASAKPRAKVAWARLSRNSSRRTVTVIRAILTKRVRH